MKAQISRDSFDPRKGYSGVYQQQGRMLTDSDWNELVDTLKHRLVRTVGAAIESGSPREGGLLGGSPPPEPPLSSIARVPVPHLRWGRIYVDGVYADLLGPADAAPGIDVAVADLVRDQRDFPANPMSPRQPPLAVGDYTLYIDVWERIVVAIEDDSLRDRALHGADTCVRTQALAQLKLRPTAQGLPRDLPGKGTAVLTLVDRPANLPNLGLVDPTHHGNLLFRLEVHDVVRADPSDPLAPTSVTLKWSTENGAEQHDNSSAAVPLGFFSERFVYEFYDETTERHLGIHAGFGSGGWTPSRAAILGHADLSKAPADDVGYVRRWDGTCELTRVNGSWQSDRTEELGTALDLSDGIHLHIDHPALERRLTLDLDDLSLGTYHHLVAGDYWLVLVRALQEQAPEVLLTSTPVGIDHHFLEIGSVTVGAGHGWSLELTGDEIRRLSFPSLTRLTLDRILYNPLPGSDDPPTIEGTLQKHRTDLDDISDEVDQLKADVAGLQSAVPQLAWAYGVVELGPTRVTGHNVASVVRDVEGEYTVMLQTNLPAGTIGSVVGSIRDQTNPKNIGIVVGRIGTNGTDQDRLHFRVWNLGAEAPATPTQPDATDDMQFYFVLNVVNVP